MSGSDNNPMLGSLMGKASGRRGNAAPSAKGAVLGTGSPNMLAQIPASGPQPVGAVSPVGDGNGHMGAWADKTHPVDV